MANLILFLVFLFIFFIVFRFVQLAHCNLLKLRLYRFAFIFGLVIPAMLGCVLCPIVLLFTGFLVPIDVSLDHFLDVNGLQ